jgi:hypothetical protein
MIAGSILRQIMRHYPLNRPRRRLLEMRPDVATNNGEFSIKAGLRLRAYPGGGDYICKQAYWFGDFDPWVDRTLARLARLGHWGQYRNYDALSRAVRGSRRPSHLVRASTIKLCDAPFQRRG